MPRVIEPFQLAELLVGEHAGGEWLVVQPATVKCESKKSDTSVNTSPLVFETFVVEMT